jgi:hypothetical protein
MKLGQAWTPADDAQLLTLLDSKMDRALIAWNLKRTVSAISKRRAILNKRRLAELGLKAKKWGAAMFDPAPNLPDDTLIEIVRFSPLIRKSLNTAGLKTIGEIRAMSDDKLRIMRGVGTGSFAYLRKTIGTGLKAKGKWRILCFTRAFGFASAPQLRQVCWWARS